MKRVGNTQETIVDNVDKLTDEFVQCNLGMKSPVIT